MGRKKKIDMVGYDDVADWLGRNPNCPDCGTTMGYNYIECMFRCPSCGRTDYDGVYMDNSYDSIYGDDGEEPECCKACGGPWPSCMTSCKIFDD